MYIPVLDDPIDLNGVSHIIDKHLNATKSSGIYGLSPTLNQASSITRGINAVILKKLFIAYLIPRKAYVCVSRKKTLLHTMKRLVCSFIMLLAIAAMYKETKQLYV